MVNMRKKSEKITIIVPCYNVENYVERCLNSLLSQSYDNVEVIMVEDCSTDGTKKIVQKYEKKYQNFRAIYNEKNGGLGHARNVGIAATKSKYIAFLDSDDWWPENFISDMYEVLIANKADISCCDIYLRYDDPRQDKRVILYTNKPDRMGLIDSGMAAASSNKLFKIELFNDLKYPEGIVNEDIPVSLAILYKYKAAYTSNTWWNYYQRSGSIQNSKITSKRFDMFKAVNLLKKNLDGKIDDKIWQAVIWQQVIAVFLYVMPRAKGVFYRKDLIEEFYSLSKENQVEIVNNWGFKKYLKFSRGNNIYGGRAIKYLVGRNFLLCSIWMGLYQFFTTNKLAKLAVKSLKAMRHPRQAARIVWNKIKRQHVIKKEIGQNDLLLAARRQYELSDPGLVSVIIPNYNYERYLVQRLYSILYQTTKIGEIIILDDNSTDSSVELVERLQKQISKYVPVRLINNANNQGTFRQWERGFSEAKNEFVWIAEADDYSHKDFLRHALRPLNENQEVVISYTDTGYINEQGLLLGSVRSDIDYYLKCGHWNKSYVNNGLEEARAYSYLNNTIANVSSVVFRKKPNTEYSKLFADARKYRQVGDWVFYINYMVHGDIAYTNKMLNYYRMHEDNVSSTMRAYDHINEILDIQKMFIKKLKLSKQHQRNMSKRIKFLQREWKVE